MRVETASTMSDASNAFTQRAALPEQRYHGFGQNESGGMRPQQSSPQMTQHQMNSALARGDHPSPDEEDEEGMNDEEGSVRSSSRKTDLEVELASKQREVSHLVVEMERLQSSINSFKEISTTKISQLEDIVNEKDRIIKDLAEKLLRQQDYCDLKRELRLLKSLEAGGWQPWCIAASEQAEPASPEPKVDAIVSESNANSNGRAPSPGAESASPSSGTHEDPGSIPATPPSASESSSQPRSPLTEQIVSGDGGVTVQRLHRHLRNNVDRFSGECLDTLGIARCVRELLSVHNIGQRVFAKLVLGLSQGTVSELLSKPKPWDKLTEKGRDSYRKMHAWACDQQCVHLLKSLLPRKGRETGTIKIETTSNEEQRTTSSADTHAATGSTNGHPDNDQKDGDAPQDSQNSSQTKLVNCHDMHQHHYRMTHGHPFHQTLGLPAGKQHGFPCGGGPTDFPPVMLAHLYQEELLKLIGKRLKEGYAEDRAKQAQEDVRQALSIYHRELALLAQQGVLGNPRPPPNGSPINHSSPCHSCSTVRRPNCTLPYCPSDQQQQQQQPCCRPVDRGPQPSGPYSVISPYSGTSPLVPLPSEGAQAPGGEETSPLQRMQSITNSLLTQNSSPSFANLPQRPAKAVLPPITQHQFDQYNNLNTEDIVKRVKEQLSQYSISQRLFGENVLGLSQGSVSDLLARPKPWHMLTQKGREPFIRMKMFLEDESAVHKLVASQYKIAPERLMRIGGYSTAPPHPGTTGNVPPSSTRYSSMCSEQAFALHHRVTASDGRQLPTKPSQTSSVPSSPQTPVSTPDRDALPQGPRSPSGPCPATLPPKPGPNRRTVGHHTRCLPCVQPSVYEMAAVTTDLDTHTVTARIKETLTVHNIGQKLFGEAVLGLSQGSVSELLSKPKPWHMLSIKGREPFIRMQLWLSDPTNVEKLQTIKSERREANKRRRNNMEHDIHPPLHTDKAPPLPPYPLDLPPVFLYPPAKKPRILFSEEQKEALRLAYTLDPYPSTAVMEFLSNELGLSVRTITNWFHNHRMRLKQLSPVGSGSSDEPDGTGFNRSQSVEGTSTFDPIRFRLLLGQRLAEMCSQQQQNQEPHMLPYFTEPLRLCPPPNYPSPDTTPLPQSGGDSDTLDLSMSSQKFPQRQPNQGSTENAASSAIDSVHSTSGESPSADDSKTLMMDNTNYESDNNSNNNNANNNNKATLSGPSTSTETMISTYEDSRLRESDSNLPNLLTSSSGSIGNSSSIVHHSGSGSNRRKPAAPQWVNPGLDLSPDSDLGSYDDSDNEGDYVDYDDDLDNDDLQWREDSEDANNSNKQIINGVCVRQTDLIPVENQQVQDSEVVHVVPTPATDNSEKAKEEREKNIRRLERAIVEQDDAWEFTDSEADDDDDGGTQNNVMSGP